MNLVVKWFEMKWGWIFIKRERRAVYAEYLRKKYKSKI
jgi:hypothetical protein